MMEHRQASRLLVELQAGSVQGEQREELREHLADCQECLAWVDTYGHFAEILSGEGSGKPTHPSSEQLARHAVDSESSTEPEQELLREHLQSCLVCRQELTLTRQALASAQEHPAGIAGARPVANRMSRSAWLALAAVVVLAILLLPIRVRSPKPERPMDRELVSEVLSGRQVIEAAGVISVTGVIVEKGSDVTLRAGEAVILRDGFSVDPGASITLEIAEALTAPPLAAGPDEEHEEDGRQSDLG